MRGTVTGYIGQIYKAERVGEYFLLSFSVAESVYLGQREGKQTSWHKCDLWGKVGESFSKYLAKGMFVAVSGQVYLHTYMKDGYEKSTMVVKANDVVMGPKAAEEHTVGNYSGTAPTQPAAVQSAPINDDGIPF